MTTLNVNMTNQLIGPDNNFFFIATSLYLFGLPCPACSASSSSHLQPPSKQPIHIPFPISFFRPRSESPLSFLLFPFSAAIEASGASIYIVHHGVRSSSPVPRDIRH